MDIRWLCLVYVITLFSRDLRCVEQDDNFTDYMHNYTNLKIFLWSGSGDGPDEPTESTATANIPSYSAAENPEDCIGGQDCNIRPTSVAPYPGVIDVPQTAEETPNKEYWIVTEFDLRSSTVVVNFSGPAMKDKLAILYTIAFTRQQARHLGLDANWTETDANSYRNRKRGSDGKPIQVGAHVLSVLNKSDLVYFVTVNGHPVAAETAVRDMSLVTTREVANCLGYPVKVKARPYLVDVSPSQSVRGVIWIFVAVASVIVVALVTGAVVAHKKKRRKNSVGSDDASNMTAAREDRPTTNRDVKTEVTEDVVRTTPEPKPRNRNRISDSLLTMQAVNTFQKNSIPGPLTDVLDAPNENNRTANALSRHQSIGGQDPGVVGPIVWDLHCKRLKIKRNGRDDDDSCSSFDAFNTGMDDDDDDETNVTKMRQKFHELLDDAFTLFGSRNSSLRSEKSSPSTSHNEQRSKSAPFRSSATSGGRPSCRPKTSADSAGGGDDDDDDGGSGGGGKFAAATSSCWALAPGEAWAGSDQSMFLPRPLSAGPFHRPTLRTEFVSSDASLSPRDPAVPLIKAIRKELDKFPSPNTAAADSSR